MNSRFMSFALAQCIRMLVILFGIATACLANERTPTISNNRLTLSFDRATGKLTSIRNQITQEEVAVNELPFALVTGGRRIEHSQFRLERFSTTPTLAKMRYIGEHHVVEVSYRLHEHYASKQLTITPREAMPLTTLTVARLRVESPDLNLVAYRYPQYERKAGEEPSCTIFARSKDGGFFTGLSTTFDSSRIADREIELSYAPSIKLRAGELYQSVEAYYGVYRRGSNEVEEAGAPLHCESEAMVATTSEVLGPPRHGFVPMVCGWHSEFERSTFENESMVNAECRSLDFMAECGVDWFGDSHPWAGETAKVNSLTGDQVYEVGELPRKLLDHARARGIKVVQWSTFSNTQPWLPQGRPFRPDKPEWLLDIDRERYKHVHIIANATGNCLANGPFERWLTANVLSGIRSGNYAGWVLDGDMFGGPGWYTTTLPVTCRSDQHDHLPGDSNHVAQRGLERLVEAVRKSCPNAYIFMCRPPMDLGVWACRNVDANFTLLETTPPESNLAAGDRIRKWSRVRTDRDFFPHYLDQPLLFPSRNSPNDPPNWKSEHLDYILLSGISCSPNLLLYLPTKSGIPPADKATLKKWLDFGRKHEAFLKVRKAFPAQPGPGVVDGSSNILEDRGLVFLFNPSEKPMTGEFALTTDELGLDTPRKLQIRQLHPSGDEDIVRTAVMGETVKWPIAGHTPVVLWIAPEN